MADDILNKPIFEIYYSDYKEYLNQEIQIHLLNIFVPIIKWLKKKKI